ncbi:sigma-70 region 4 domain-containing protein [Streptomyces zaomyceticus]|uniref:sigma-70 region 4 domain-containing protein n=1 Tax=Streptomyces zaomyceticus TaxID=68286 RepID=UPI00344384B4
MAKPLPGRSRDPVDPVNGPVGQSLRALGGELEFVPRPLGLYEAISELPVRQYTVIVMRFPTGCSTEQVARYMHIGGCTVNHHSRRSRRCVLATSGTPVSRSGRPPMFTPRDA